MTETRTLVLLVERTVTTPAAEGVGLRVPLTGNIWWRGQTYTNAYRNNRRTRRMWYLCTVTNPYRQLRQHSSLMCCTNLSSVHKKVVSKTSNTLWGRRDADPSSDIGSPHPSVKLHQISPFNLSACSLPPNVPPTVKNSGILTMVS